MNKLNEKDYESPVVKIIEVDVEKGFAGSGGATSYGDSIEGWGDGGSYEESLF